MKKPFDALPWRKSPLALGLDIGSANVKLVELKLEEGNYKLVKLALHPLPQGAMPQRGIIKVDEVCNVVNSLLKDQGLRNRKVAVAIAGHAVIVKRLLLPSVKAEEAMDVLKVEIQRYIPDVEGVNFDYHILSEKPEGTELLLVAARKDVVNNYLKLFDNCDAQLSILDIDLFALQNAFEVNYPYELDNVVALCDIGATVMSILVTKGGECLFARDVAVGGNMFTEEIQKELGVGYEEAELLKYRAAAEDSPKLRKVLERVSRTVALEIAKSLDFFLAAYPNTRIQKLYLTGGASKLYGLSTTIAERTGLEVEAFNPFNNLLIDADRFSLDYLREMAPFSAVAVGLALRRV